MALEIIRVVCDSDGVVYEADLSWSSFVEAVRVVQEHTEHGHMVDVHMGEAAAAASSALTGVADQAVLAATALF